QFASDAIHVQVEQRMVDDAPRAGAEFNGFDPLVLGEIERENEIAINVAPLGVEFEWTLHFQNEVWFAELPALSERRQLRQTGRIPLRHSLLVPLSQRANLFRGQHAR